MALGGGSTTDSTDSMSSSSVWGVGIAYQLYNRLIEVVPAADGKGLDYVPSLAEEATYETPTKLVLRLREGVEFHNGKTLTAEDVIYSLQRQVDPKVGGAAAVLLGSIDFNATSAIDKRTVAIVMNKPDTFLRTSLSSNYISIYPTDWDPKQPIGTGPWKLADFTAGQSISFTRFDNYFEGPVYADDLSWQSYSDDAALVNALSSGAVNLLGSVPGPQIKVLEANSEFKIARTPTGSCFTVMAMNTTTGPFTDNRVREAFKLMVDRDAVVQQVYGGEAVVGNDMWNSIDPSYAAAGLPQRQYDPEKAKSLLAAAGQTDIQLTLATGGFGPNFEVVLAEGAKAAGVTLNVKKVDQGTFYTEHYMVDPVFTSGMYARPAGQIFALTMLPTSPWAETAESNPEYGRLYSEAASTTDEAKQTELVVEMQRLMHTESGYVQAAYLNQVDATSANVNGAVADATGRPFGSFNFRSMWLS